MLLNIVVSNEYTFDIFHSHKPTIYRYSGQLAIITIIMMIMMMMMMMIKIISGQSQRTQNPGMES